MSNEILFVGGRLDSVVQISGSSISEQANASSFEAAYSDCSIRMGGPSDVIEAQNKTLSGGALAAASVVSGETFWFHKTVYSTNSAIYSGINLILLMDNSGNPWVSVRGMGSGLAALHYNSGTGGSPTWTQFGSSFNWFSGTLRPVDLRVTLGSPHSASFYIGDTLVASGTFTQAAFTAIRATRISAMYDLSSQHYSQIMATRGISTIGAKVKTLRATGAGSNSGWTGAHTNVNEAVNSDATFDSTAAAAAKQSYALADLTVPSGYTLGTPFHWLRAKNDGAAPSNIKSLIRSGGTDYSSANLAGIGFGYGPIGLRYDLDPDGGALSAAKIAGWEAGYEAAT